MSAVEQQPQLLQIGAVAERTGLSIRTLRHFDDVGLVVPSARSAGGFRLYTEADVERATAVRGMKPLGFTLAEMRQLLDALDARHGGRTEDSTVLTVFHERASRRCDELRGQLADAEALTQSLGPRS